MSLIARYLEEHGIPTVVIGTARDIVESANVPRFLFVDFPLGSPCGEPWDVDQQRAIFEQALSLFETGTVPGATVRAPYEWSKGQKWKELIFTEEQPFLRGDAEAEWLARKEEYRKLRAEGKV